MVLFVSGPDDRFDVSTNVEVAFDFHSQWIARGDEVFEDDVDHVLVENLHVTERVYVELQAFQFDTTFVGNVFEPDRGEVWKVGEWANRCELGDLEIDFDLVAGKFVRKRVQRKQIHLRTRRRLNVETLLVWRQQRTFGCGHRLVMIRRRRWLIPAPGWSARQPWDDKTNKRCWILNRGNVIAQTPTGSNLGRVSIVTTGGHGGPPLHLMTRGYF